MASANNSRMPTTGRHRVDIGSSLGRALKARKGGAAPAKRSNLPSRDFYSFRYAFKPPSVDNTKPGTAEMTAGKESTSVMVEHPSTQEGESLIFTGTEEPAKELDCVLIYDEETGTFTLERVESFIALKYEKKTASTSRPRPSASPMPRTPVPYSSTPKPSTDDLDLEAQLEDILQDKDADGELEEQLEEILPTILPPKPQEEPKLFVPPRSTLPAPAPSKRAPPKTSKANGKMRKEAAPPAPPIPTPAPIPTPTMKTKPQPKAKQVPQSKAPPPQSSTTHLDVEEEVFEFGLPSVPVKHKPQTSAPSEGLAFPGSNSSSLFVPPPAVSFDAPIPPAADSEDEEWDEVPAVSPLQPIEASEEAEGEDIDLNDLQAQMDAELGGASDDEMSPEPEPQRATGAPMSLQQFAEANGGAVYPGYDDDDYTSSDDSDDD
ncbi:EAF family protein [Pleurotus pulmonarius]